MAYGILMTWGLRESATRNEKAKKKKKKNSHIVAHVPPACERVATLAG